MNGTASTAGAAPPGNAPPQVRFRASCDACNESKLRCSQTKPTCHRCQRIGITCVFGLSRRTHKDAPRIMSRSRSPRRGSSSSRLMQTPPELAGSVAPPPPHHLDGSILFPTGSHLRRPLDLNSVFASQQSASAMAPAGPFQGVDLRALFALDQLDALNSSPVTAATTAPPAAGVSSTIDPRLANDDVDWGFSPLPSPQPTGPALSAPQLSQQQPLGTSNPALLENHNAAQDENHGETLGHHNNHPHRHHHHQHKGANGCSCSSRVVPELIRMSQAHLPAGPARRQLSFDVELLYLKEAILACEASIRCQSHSSDPTVVLIIGLHIGVIVDGFKTLLTTASGDPQLHQAPVQKLEDDDEAALRHQLCQLYFRRLGTLVGFFNESVRQFHDAQELAGSIVATFNMAYNYMRLWLEQKMEAVKKLFRSGGSEDEP